MIVFLLLIGITACAGWYVFASDQTADAESDMIAALEIFGGPVEMEEYQMLLERQKSDVYAYFTAVHKIQPGDLSWDRSYGGEVPVDMLMERTFEQLMQNRFIFSRAKEMGVLKEGSFREFKDIWIAERERRKQGANQETQQGLNAGAVVYGPVDIEMYEYYDYFLEELKGIIKEGLWDKEQPAHPQLEQYMQEHKELYGKPKSAEATRLYTEAQDGGPGYEALHQCLEVLTKGGTVGEALEKADGLVKEEDIRIDEESYHHDSNVYPALREKILLLQEGDITPVTENAATYDIAVINKTEETGFYTLEEVYPAVKHEWVEDLYQAEFKKWNETSEIEVNQDLRQWILERYI